MSDAPGPAVSPNAPQTCSTLLLPPQITPKATSCQGAQQPGRPQRQARTPSPTHTANPYSDRTSGDVRHTRVPDSGAELGKRVWPADGAVLLREAVSWVFTRRARPARSRGSGLAR